MKVVVKNIQFHNPGWAFKQPETFTYTGELVDLKHIKDYELALSTGNAEWPVRVLQKHLIVSIDTVPYNYTPDGSSSAPKRVTKKSPGAGKTTATPLGTSNTEWAVQGSADKTYTVSKNNTKWSCTCKGFAFRNHCRHIENIKKTAAA